MDIPTNLKHKPLFIIDNYNEIDGKYSNNTDAQALSLGFAQWNGIRDHELSVKVWRYTGEKWSRQSEELPLHRAIDLTTLICKVIRNQFSEKNEDELKIKVLANENQLMLLRSELSKDQDEIKKHLTELLEQLNELKLEGKI